MSHYLPQPSVIPMQASQCVAPVTQMAHPEMGPPFAASNRYPTYEEFLASHNYNHNGKHGMVPWERYKMPIRSMQMNHQVHVSALPHPVPYKPLHPKAQLYKERLPMIIEQSYSDGINTGKEQEEDRRSLSPIPTTNRLFELKTPPKMTKIPTDQNQNPRYHHGMIRDPQVKPVGVPMYSMNPPVQAMHNPPMVQPPMYHHNPVPAAIMYPPYQFHNYQPMMPLAHYGTNPYPQYVQQPLQHVFHPMPPMMPVQHQQWIMHQQLLRNRPNPREYYQHQSNSSLPVPN